MALSGYHICLSGFHDDDDDDDDDGDDDDNNNNNGVSAGAGRRDAGMSYSMREMWALGESLGAVMQPHITKRTTVLVAQRGLTRKRLAAEQHHIPVVSPRWLLSHGRLSFADARVALLAGYTFCATQMAADEEKTLACVIERNGGKFCRTLTTRTSMLFMPPGWLKRWLQLQQQHRYSGRSSTELQGGGVPSSLPLPEKMRFAWATGVPVVEYTRFLSMAALSSSSGDDGGAIVTCDGASSRADFDTIVQLCAVPDSAVGGAVLHTQQGTAPSVMKREGGEEEEEEEEEEKRKALPLKGTHARKRSRNLVEDGKHGINEEHDHNDNDDDDYDDYDDACSRGRKQMAVRTAQAAVAKVETGVSSSESLEQQWQRGHDRPRNDWRMSESGMQGDDRMGVMNPPSWPHGEQSEASLLGSGLAAAAVSSHYSCAGIAHPLPHDLGDDDSNKLLTTETLFTHSRPFLQVVFLGCTARELVDCTRMALHCRFLRTPVVTHLTDVVVIGSELLQETLGGPIVGPGGTSAQHQQQGGLALLQLRHNLTTNYGVPIQSIVTIEWLRSCYQRMMLLVPSTPHTCTVGDDVSAPFLPSPLPLSDVPSTENFQLRIPCTTSFLDGQPQAQRQRQQQQQPLPLKQFPSRPRKKRALDAVSKQRGSCDNVRPQVAPTLPEDILTAKKRYESERLLADRRVKDFLALLDVSVDSGEEWRLPFTSCLFCFVENEFSRIELAVVRALIKHGGGAWLKKTRDDWTRLLTRSSALATTENEWKAEQEEEEQQQQQQQHVDEDFVVHVRRCSVIRKRLHRAQAAAAAAASSSSILVDDEMSTRWSLHYDGRCSLREPPHGFGKKPSLQHALYVLPHGDQRPVDILLRDEGKRGASSQRHPLRYLHAVTQDYVLCCLAAQRLLQPCSCFLFWQPVPSEAERLARRQWRGDDGRKRPLALSLWLGPRRHEKAPLIGVSVYFLCVTNRQQEETEEEAEAAVALRRVLVSSLTAAVSDLGGHGAETLLQEAVTHVVVVDFASVFASALVTDDADTTPPEYWWWSWCCKAEEEREALLSRSSTWPHGIQDQLPQDLVEDATAGRLSLVGIEWLHASVAWGVFLDETPFSLQVSQVNHHHRDQQQKQQGQLSVMAVSAAPTASAGLSCSAATPPATPRQRRFGPYGLGPAPLDLSTRKGISSSPQAVAGYQFDFTTPTSTPGRPHNQRDALNERRSSGMRHSCPRSTLRTPQRHRMSIPRVISPTVAMVGDTATNTSTVMNIAMPSSSSSEDELDPRRETMTPPQCFGAMESSRHACTPVRKTCILGDDSNANNSVGDDGVEGSCTQFSRFSIGGRSPAMTVEMPQQWDPDGGGGGSGGGGGGASKRLQERTPLALAVQKSAAYVSRSPWQLNDDDGGGVGGGALRLHIVHDLPLRESLVVSCSKLSDLACHGGGSSSSSSSMGGGGGGGGGENSPFQRHLHRQADVTGVVIRVQLVEHSVRDADVLVTHQLTQRESVLAAIAAGLWVVTPKALQDCEASQSYLPLRDLSVYEWCPELLMPDAPRSSMQLARQCRNRRQQRQATGRRLFEDRRFVLVSPASSVGASRARSMRTILEAGGGVVAWATYPVGDGDATSKSGAARTMGVAETNAPPERSSSVAAAVDHTFLSSPAELLEFVAMQIRGQCTNAVGNVWNASVGAQNCRSAAEKELVVLVDNVAEGVATRELLVDMVLGVFRHARDQLGEARRLAVERRKRSQQQQLQPQQQLLQANQVQCDEMKGVEVQQKFVLVGQPVNNLQQPHSILHSNTTVPLAASEGRISSGTGSVIIGDTSTRKQNNTDGMPFVEVVRVFASDWVTLTIQQRRKAPLCVVEIPS